MVAFASYVLGVPEENASGMWLRTLTKARSDRTVKIPIGTSTCSFSNTSNREITVCARLVYENEEVIFLPDQTIRPGQSAVFKVSNAGNCYLSVVQRGWIDPKTRFGLEVITMPSE